MGGKHLAEQNPNKYGTEKDVAVPTATSHF